MSPRRHTRSFANRWTLWIGAILGLCVGLRGLTPYALVAGAESIGGRALGRAVELDNIDLALHRGGFLVEGVRIGGALPTDGAPVAISSDNTILSIASASAEWSWWSLLRGTLHLRSVEVVAPEVRLEHKGDGSLTRFVLVEEEPGVEHGEPAGAWPVVLDLFSLRDADLTLAYGGENEVEFQLAELTLGELAFREGQLLLGAVGLREPQVRVRREIAIGERRIEVAPSTASAGRSAHAEPSSIPGPRIRAIEIERAEFTLLTDEVPLEVALALSAQNVTVDPYETFPIALHLEIAGGTLDVEGQVGAAPPRFDGSVDWARVGFPILTRALGLELPIQVESVLSSGKLEVTAHMGAGDEDGNLSLAGELHAERVAAVVVGTRERLQVDFLDLGLRGFEMPLVADPTRAAAARFSGTVSSRGVSFQSPDGGLAVRLAHTGATELAVEIPLGAKPGAVRVSGRVSAADIAIEARSGDRVGVRGIDLALAELVAHTGAEAAEALEIEASVSAEAIVLTSPAQGVSASVARAEFRDVVAAIPASSENKAPRFQTGPIRINRPRLLLTRMVSSAPTASPPRATAATRVVAPDPRARIASLAVREGVVVLVDEGVEPFARSRIEEIDLVARDVRWPERTVGRFELKSRGPSQATFTASGALGESGQIDWVLSSLPLPHFNPYAKPVGYRIEKGEAGIRGEMELAGERVAVDSQLLLDRLELATYRSEEFEQQIGVPLGLAVALLQDPAGRISLPLRFEAERDEVRAQILPLVLATLRHAVVGAVTLPFKALNGLATGAGNDDLSLSLVTAAPGLAEPAPSTVGEVEALAKLLAERPQLGLVIRGQVGPEDEHPLARVVLAEHIQRGGEFSDSVEMGFFARRRLRNALGEHGPMAAQALGDEDRALLEELVAATQVSARRKRTLADARATALREALVRGYGVSPERIRVASAADSGAPGSAPELVAVNTLPSGDEAAPPPVSSDAPSASGDH